MARATSMERIEKLRLQLEEAERKEAEKAEKRAAVEAERAQKKRASLEQRLGRLHEQQERVEKMIAETQAQLDELPEEAFVSTTLEVVSDDTDAVAG